MQAAASSSDLCSLALSQDGAQVLVLHKVNHNQPRRLLHARANELHTHQNTDTDTRTYTGTDTRTDMDGYGQQGFKHTVEAGGKMRW